MTFPFSRVLLAMKRVVFTFGRQGLFVEDKAHYYCKIIYRLTAFLHQFAIFLRELVNLAFNMSYSFPASSPTSISSTEWYSLDDISLVP
ncbi:MAG: hypothetical protein Pg6C_03230 [Treponemataceae bacterium]|nr:MAG: hypothetical protein Pg6C_03230 [Treponemataceae bacterium]